jgi:class 3 adenylate cyclase
MAHAQRARKAFLIAFIDLTRFDAESQRVDDGVIAETLDAYYERVTRAIESAGGTVVKFIGDAALIVFPTTSVDAGARALFDLKPSVDRWMQGLGWECRLIVKAHFGEAIAGDFGAESSKRFDVIGRAVNTAARLKGGATDVTLSLDALQQLSPETRARYELRTAHG